MFRLDPMILAPVVYIAAIIGTMATFFSLYRKRQAIQAATMERWFPTNLARDVYLSLLHLPDVSSSAQTKPVPDTVLRAALLRRAVAVIHRAIEVRNAKGPLQQLLARGSVGDDTWTQFTQAEQDLDAELKEIMEEANSLSPPGMTPLWGAFIFQSAAEMAHNEKFKAKVEKEKEKSEDAKKLWDARRDKVRKEFLESQGIKDDQPSAAPVPAVAEKTPIAKIEQKAKSLLTPGSSDEDGVLVEAVSTGTATPTRPPAVTTPSGSMRKKKGKR